MLDQRKGGGRRRRATLPERERRSSITPTLACKCNLLLYLMFVLESQFLHVTSCKQLYVPCVHSYHSLFCGIASMAYKRKTGSRSRAPSRYRRRRSYRYRRTGASRPARSYRRKRTMSRRRKKVPISKFVLAQLDPFSDKVAGVKIPDANTQPSATAIVEDEYALTTGATYGTAVNAYRPFVLGQQVAPATINSATGWSWAGSYGGTNNSSKYLSITSNHRLIRTCAYGVRITCALAPNNVTGYVHVCLAPMSDFSNTTWTLPTSISEMQNSPFYKRYPLAVLTQKPLKVVAKIIDENGFRYIASNASPDAQATAMTLQHSGWTAICVAVSGVSVNTTAVSVESLLHLETIPFADSAVSTSPAAPSNGSQMDLASSVSSGSNAASLEGTTSPQGGYTEWLSDAANSAIQSGRSVIDWVADSELARQWTALDNAARDRARQALLERGLELAMGYLGGGGANRPLLTG